MDTIIKAEGLKKSFLEKKVLKGVDLEVKKGSIYGLLGANGSGKTTLMKIILGLLKASEGKLSIFGNDIRGEDRSYLKKVGSLIETPVFYQGFNVRENLELHCQYLGTEYIKDIPLVLERVGLKGIEKMRIRELSLGMKQRLAIARALLCKPELLILDEPINGIDPKGIVEMRNLLLDINKVDGITIIVSSHIINEMEKLADTIGILSDGIILEEIDKKQFTEATFSLEDHFLKLLNNTSNIENIAV